MLIAHLVPGFLGASKSRTGWRPQWTRRERTLLWAGALVSTFAPDMDVIYNALFRGFISHSTLWTHSLFVHLAVGSIWLILKRTGRYSYLQTLAGLVALGGLSHLALDVLSHGTPLLYPLSMAVIGFPSQRIAHGGFWTYITDPIFLAEPMLLALAFGYWVLHLRAGPRLKKMLLVGTVGGLVLFVGAFISALPMLQAFAAAREGG